MKEYVLNRLKHSNKTLWGLCVLFVVISLVAVYSSCGYSAIALLNMSPEAMLLRHSAFVLVSIVIALFVAMVPYSVWGKSSNIIYIGVFVMLLLALLAGGRWIGFAGKSFQPSEFAKISLVMTFAYIINRNRENLEGRRVAIMLAIAWAGLSIPILKENLSTVAIISVVCLLMMLLAGVNKKFVGYAALLFFGGGVLILILMRSGILNIDFLARESTWNHRIDTWLHGSQHMDELSQENLAKMAISRGGLFGTGIGSTIYGRIITQAQNDFIFAIIIEEIGSLRAMIIFVLYTMFYYTCCKIARKSKGLFGSMLVAGLSTLIYFQAIINMGVAVGLFPVTGQTLPFISYGGSAFLAMGASIGLIQSVSIDNKINEEKKNLSIESDNKE